MSAEDDLRRLRDEAQSLGFHYTGSAPEQLEKLLVVLRAQKAKDGPHVPCWGIAYDTDDRRCRVCQLRQTCANTAQKPIRDQPAERLMPVPCEECIRGALDVPLADDAGEVVDFGCTTKGCHHTLGLQCGWTQAAPAELPVAFEPKRKQKVDGVMDEEAAAEIRRKARDAVVRGLTLVPHPTPPEPQATIYRRKKEKPP